MQTIASPTTGYRLIGVLLVAVALVVALTLSAVHYASGTGTTSRTISGTSVVDRCLIHHPC